LRAAKRSLGSARTQGSGYHQPPIFIMEIYCFTSVLFSHALEMPMLEVATTAYHEPAYLVMLRVGRSCAGVLLVHPTPSTRTHPPSSQAQGCKRGPRQNS
jgi:hypothetical protein